MSVPGVQPRSRRPPSNAFHWPKSAGGALPGRSTPTRGIFADCCAGTATDPTRSKAAAATNQVTDFTNVRPRAGIPSNRSELLPLMAALRAVPLPNFLFGGTRVSESADPAISISQREHGYRDDRVRGAGYPRRMRSPSGSTGQPTARTFAGRRRRCHQGCHAPNMRSAGLRTAAGPRLRTWV